MQFINSHAFRSLPAQSPIVVDVKPPRKQSIMPLKQGPTESSKYRLEMRLFDGRMNETKEQALQDFERTNGFFPQSDEMPESHSP